MDKVMDAYRAKKISKEDIDKVMRAFQETTNAVKSKDRDDAIAWEAMTDSQKEEYLWSFRERALQT